MLHLDGFEQYGNELNMSGALTRAGYQPAGVGQWASVSGRGKYSRALSGQGVSLNRPVEWLTNKMSVGFACTFSGRGSMAWITAGGQDVTFWLNPDTGLPTLNTVVGGALPTKNRFYFYELEMDRVAGKISLYINGRFDCEFAMTPAMTAANSVQVGFGYRPPSEYRPGVTPVPVDSSIKTFDDFYIRDGARLNPIIITTRFPNTDIKTEWFKAGTDNTHAETLSHRPPDVLDTYVASDTIGKEERFTSTQDLTNANDVIATGVVVLARKSPTLAAKVGVFMGGQSGAALRQDTRTVGSEWQTQFVCFEAVIGDTPTGIINSEFGFTVSNP